MEKPWVSAIIAARNGEKYISQALESIFNQDYENIEILVVDNGSSDATSEIVKSYSRVKYVYFAEPNVALARTKGVELAKNDYIAFLDQDDVWVKDKISRQVRFLEENVFYGGVVGHQKLFLEEGTKKPHWLKASFLEYPQTGYLPSTFLVKRQVFEKINKGNTRHPSASDVAWFFNAKTLNILIGMLPEVLVHRRIHDENETHKIAELHRGLLSVMRESIQSQRSHACEA